MEKGKKVLKLNCWFLKHNSSIFIYFLRYINKMFIELKERAFNQIEHWQLYPKD